MVRKGIILAGGKGTRLMPATMVVSKQLLPIYDKPLVYYPLCVLMQAKIRDILVISTPHDIENFQRLLGDGSSFGVSISYAVQKDPRGLADAFIVGESFIDNKPSVLILGDNIFYGHDLPILLKQAYSKEHGATVFAYHINDPENYGVIEFNSSREVISIHEKPKYPKSNYAITGLYFYDETACEKAHSLSPSKRGEIEITDLNNLYLRDRELTVEVMGRGFTWFDTGTHDSMLEASQYIAALEKRQGLKIASPEEIAFNNDWISAADIELMASKLLNSGYGQYLFNLLKEENCKSYTLTCQD